MVHPDPSVGPQPVIVGVCIGVPPNGVPPSGGDVNVHSPQARPLAIDSPKVFVVSCQTRTVNVGVEPGGLPGMFTGCEKGTARNAAVFGVLPNNAVASGVV